MTDRSNRSISDIFVELLDEFSRTVSRTRTNGAGQYTFSNMPAGIYKVRVLAGATNYVEQTQEVEITNFTQRRASGEVTVSGGELRQLDFVLRTRGGGNATAPGVVFAQTIPAEAQAAYEKGVRALDSPQPEQSGLEDLKRAVDLFPSYFIALDRLGQEYLKRGDFEAARIALLKAIEVNPRSYLSLYALGLTQYRLKQVEEAIKSLERSIALNANSINSHLWLGIIYRQQGKFDNAEKQLVHAKGMSKSSIPEAHWQLALLYNQLQRFGAAADELELFIKAQPDARDAANIKKLIQQLREKARTQPSARSQFSS